jgi:hypothetical protein
MAVDNVFTDDISLTIRVKIPLLLMVARGALARRDGFRGFIKGEGIARGNPALIADGEIVVHVPNLPQVYGPDLVVIVAS